MFQIFAKCALPVDGVIVNYTKLHWYALFVLNLTLKNFNYNSLMKIAIIETLRLRVYFRKLYLITRRGESDFSIIFLENILSKST